eukprot:TRINITY_DN4830_c0_g1_i1.p1 TRINITY_DN4830_c0_g1~~TRINITY_DN4830_c0_g1_i1.p1  ORF type:complete len:196 (+),score=1.82 TRINITY_DN4830_c0_g1_i1:37-624(+)
MKPEKRQVAPLMVAEEHIADVTRCLLHTIIFNRAIGVVKPKDVVLEGLEVSYVKCDNEAVETAVETKVKRFCEYFHQKKKDRGKILLTFSEKKITSSWFGRKSEELLPFEDWVIGIAIPSEKTIEYKKEDLYTELNERMMSIILLCSSTAKKLPKITSKEPIPFPFEITVADTSDSWGTDLFWGILLKPESVVLM